MSILGIIFVIVMLFLIGKAIVETIWGLILIAYGLACYLLATLLRILAWIIGVSARIGKFAR